ncbi:chemotaxis protein CheB [Gammaproteobacteria bacterium 45_16_T64]|nr:chemotaxis protein CheB [Gammaproteobacteria bacterium 45_16_T64]
MNTESDKKYEAAVIGVSAGGLDALHKILSVLPADLSFPIVIVQHRADDSDTFLTEYLNDCSELAVKEAQQGCLLKAGDVWLAPSGYHVLIEKEKVLSLSVDLPVNSSIPSIDVLFESAADVFFDRLVGVVLTGASSDGSVGLKKIKSVGGFVVVEDPETAYASVMPRSAMQLAEVECVLPLDEIGPFLGSLSHG